MVIVVLDEWSARNNGKQIGKRNSRSLGTIRNRNLEFVHCPLKEDIDDPYDDILLEIRNSFNWGSFLKQTKDNLNGYLEKFKCQTQPLIKFFNTRRVYCQYCQRLTENNNLIDSTPNKITVNSRFNDCYVDKISSKGNTMTWGKSHTSFSCDRCQEQYILKRKEVKNKCPICSKCGRNNRYDNNVTGKRYYSADAVDNQKQCTCLNGGREDDMWNMQFKRWWGWNVGRKRNRYDRTRRDCCWCPTPQPRARYRMEPWDAYDTCEERKKTRIQYKEPPYYPQAYQPRRRSVSCFSYCFGYPRQDYKPQYQPCYCSPEKQLGRRDMQNADRYMYQSWMKETSSNSSNSLYHSGNKGDPGPYRNNKSSVEYLSCRIESVTANLNGAYECCCCCPCRTEHKTACCQTNTVEKQVTQAAQTQRQCCKCCRKKCNKCKPVCTQSSKNIAPQTKTATVAVKQTSAPCVNLTGTSSKPKFKENNTNMDNRRKQQTISTNAIVPTQSNNTSTENLRNNPSASTETTKAPNKSTTSETMKKKTINKNNNANSSNEVHSAPAAKNKQPTENTAASVKATPSKSASSVKRATVCNCKRDLHNIYFGHIKTSPLFLDPIFSSPLTGRKYSISPKTRRAINKNDQPKPLNDLEEIYPPFLNLEMQPDKVLKLQKSNLNQHSIEEFFDLQSRDSCLDQIQTLQKTSNDLSRMNLPEFLRTNSLLNKCELRDIDNIIENLKHNETDVQECRKSRIQEVISNCQESNNTPLIEASKLVSDIMEKSIQIETNVEAARIVTDTMEKLKNECVPSTSNIVPPIIPPPPDFATHILTKSNLNDCCDNGNNIHYDVNYSIKTIENPVNVPEIAEAYTNIAKCHIPEASHNIAKFHNDITTNSFMNDLRNNIDDMDNIRKNLRIEVNDEMTSTNLIERNSTGTSTVDLSSSVTFLNELDLLSSEASDDLKPLPKIYKTHRSFGDLFRRNRKKIFKSTKNDKSFRESAETNCCMTTKKKLN